jgi:Single-stranded DNA binding protein Ssb-like, OB fold
VRKLRRKQTIGDYIVLLSEKYDVYPSELFRSLVSASEEGKANCGELSIECRSITKDKISFMVKKGAQLVGQFPVPIDFLHETDSSLLNAISPRKIRKRVTPEKTEAPIAQSIKQVRAGMSHVNLRAKVVEVTPSRRVTTRYGNYATLAKALIEDETGSIKLCLWNTQIEAVKVGDTIVIKDAKASRFRGETQLSMGTKGTMQKEGSTTVMVPLAAPAMRLSALPA